MPSQKELQHELNARIPRGRDGSVQNYFRECWWFFRKQGKSFEERVRLALDIIHKDNPDFVSSIRA